MAVNQGEKFKDFLYGRKIGPQSAADMLGVSRNMVYKYYTTYTFTPEVLERILKVFKATESDLFGEPQRDGEVNQKPATKKTPRFDAEPLRLADPYGFEATGEKFYTLPDGSRVMQIPVIPIKAWGSYPRGYGDPEYYEGFETITVPVNQLHKGMYLAWEVKDDSMVNIENHEMARKSIWPRQKIVGREIRREAWQYKLHISPDEAWVVVHKDDGITVKEISEHDTKTGIITLHSWNPDKETHPDFQWHLDDIQQIFHVVDPFAKMRPY